MKHAIAVVVVQLVVLLSSRWAHAQDPIVRARPRFALGISNALELRRDYGDALRVMYAPELVGQGYLRLHGSLFLRPGLRVGYDGIRQAEQPRDVQIVERGFHLLAESAVLYDWVVVPTLSFGIGTSTRFISAHTSAAITGGSALNRSETLLLLMVQLGVGIPLGHFGLMLEPYARFQEALSDKRALARLGFDLTFGF